MSTGATEKPLHSKTTPVCSLLIIVTFPNERCLGKRLISLLELYRKLNPQEHNYYYEAQAHVSGNYTCKIDSIDDVHS